MIAETRFAKSYNSLWRSLTPTMELFVRKVNLHLADRNWDQLAASSHPGHRALINRVAFQLLMGAVSSSQTGAQRLEFIGSVENVAAIESSLVGSRVLNSDSFREIIELSSRMYQHLYTWQRSQVTLNPRFAGCGIINTCNGDVICADSKIIELKDGDRPFRAYEFRQLTIYAALHMNDTGIIPSEIEVINSRRGLSASISMVDFAKEVAGQAPYDLLDEVIRTISDITILY